MKTLATLALFIVLAQPALAGVVHNEAVDGDLSSDPNNPTPVAFALGSNLIINGSMGNTGSPTDVRDYIKFTIPAEHKLAALHLNAYAPNDVGFASFNTGTVSFIPNVSSDPLFLSGIHLNGDDAGTDILPRFVDRNVTQNALPVAELAPGDYCFLIQQTGPILIAYELDFVVDVFTPVQPTTFGRIRSLYR